MITSVIYEPESVKVSGHRYHYKKGEDIVALELIQGLAMVNIQGSPENMSKLLNVIARVLRNPEES